MFYDWNWLVLAGMSINPECYVSRYPIRNPANSTYFTFKFNCLCPHQPALEAELPKYYHLSHPKSYTFRYLRHWPQWTFTTSKVRSYKVYQISVHSRPDSTWNLIQAVLGYMQYFTRLSSHTASMCKAHVQGNICSDRYLLKVFPRQNERKFDN